MVNKPLIGLAGFLMGLVLFGCDRSFVRRQQSDNALAYQGYGQPAASANDTRMNKLNPGSNSPASIAADTPVPSSSATPANPGMRQVGSAEPNAFANGGASPQANKYPSNSYSSSTNAFPNPGASPANMPYPAYATNRQGYPYANNSVGAPANSWNTVPGQPANLTPAGGAAPAAGTDQIVPPPAPAQSTIGGQQSMSSAAGNGRPALASQANPSVPQQQFDRDTGMPTSSSAPACCQPLPPVAAPAPANVPVLHPGDNPQ